MTLRRRSETMKISPPINTGGHRFVFCVHLCPSVVIFRRTMSKRFFAACCLLVICPTIAWGHNNEVSQSAGGGGLLSGGKSVSTAAYTLAYTRHLTERVAAEGAFEVFIVRGDDLAGAQAAVLYHFRPADETRRRIPYATAGIGTTSTDFTEIESQLVIRLGCGIKYYFLQSLGLRLEFRDEIIRTGSSTYYPLPGSP